MQHSIMLKIGIFWHQLDISANVHSPQVVSSNNELALIYPYNKLRHQIQLCGLNDKTLRVILAVLCFYCLWFWSLGYKYLSLSGSLDSVSVNSIRLEYWLLKIRDFNFTLKAFQKIFCKEFLCIF